MAKPNKPQKIEQQEPSQEMTMEQARAFRAAKHVPIVKPLTEDEKREEFRKFWASNKRKYGDPRNIEKALWLHLKTMKMDTPEQFKQGCEHFGLKSIK